MKAVVNDPAGAREPACPVHGPADACDCESRAERLRRALRAARKSADRIAGTRKFSPGFWQQTINFLGVRDRE